MLDQKDHLAIIRICNTTPVVAKPLIFGALNVFTAVIDVIYYAQEGLT